MYRRLMIKYLKIRVFLSPQSLDKFAIKAYTTNTKDALKGIGFSKEQNFPKWYSRLIVKSELIEYYSVSGCYILRPWAYAIWENIQRFFDAEIKKMGVKNCYFPMFVSRSTLERERTHISNFSPEVAWVTKVGNTQMSEEIAIRPTSEAIIYPSLAKWVQSHKNLPIKLNQWCNVVRWEFRHPTPFLRAREFLWQEGHTAYQTSDEAEKEVYQILDLYAQIYTELLAIPVVKGMKSEKEKFAGAVFTTTVEAYISANGRGIQGGTSHHLGQNFSKIFDISFKNPKKLDSVEYVWQNSWGLSTRTIGAVVMVHGDDKGLVLPPRVAPIQVIVVPVGITVKMTEEQRRVIISSAKEISNRLHNSGVRSECDLRDDVTPGWKFNHYELKGVPIRIEIGPKDLDKNQVLAVLRFSGEKRPLQLESLDETIKLLLDEVHTEMYKNALRIRDERMNICLDWSNFSPLLNQKMILLSPFCGDNKCETEIKDKSTREGDDDIELGVSQMGAKILCIPLQQPTEVELPKKCISPNCVNLPKYFALFGRSY